MTFRDREKKRYEATRHTLFGPEASGHGTYRGISRPFCLPDDHSSHNLYDGIREEAITYFSQRSITWHDGHQLGRYVAVWASQLAALVVGIGPAVGRDTNVSSVTFGAADETT